jgi:hypothetical protein
MTADGFLTLIILLVLGFALYGAWDYSRFVHGESKPKKERKKVKKAAENPHDQSLELQALRTELKMLTDGGLALMGALEMILNHQPENTLTWQVRSSIWDVKNQRVDMLRGSTREQEEAQRANRRARGGLSIAKDILEDYVAARLAATSNTQQIRDEVAGRIIKLANGLSHRPENALLVMHLLNVACEIKEEVYRELRPMLAQPKEPA